MQITPEIQKLIDSEVEKRTSVLESTYRNNFEELKDSMYSTMKEFARDVVINNVQLESIDNQCNNKHFKPIVEGIVNVLRSNGIPIVLTESNNSDSAEAKSLLLEAVNKIQELRDMLAIHEMIENGLVGLDRGIIENTLNRFKNEPRYSEMPKDQFLKEVANYVLNMKNMPNSKSVQFEASEIISDAELNLVSGLVESKGSLTAPFNPHAKINIPKLRKKVLDEAYSVEMPIDNIDEYDPAQEVLDTWNVK